MTSDPSAAAAFDEADVAWMRAAIDEAGHTAAAEDVPVGAVVIHAGKIIGRGYNQRERSQDPTAHAEMVALKGAAQRLNCWRLHGCTLYVTLEPCAMCAGAIVLARVERLVFGAFDPKAGACGSIYEIQADPRLNHRVPTLGGVLEPECARLLREFFQRRRALGERG